MHDQRNVKIRILMSCGNTVSMLPVTVPALQYFSTYLIKSTFVEKKLLYIKCVLIFSTNFVCNISHSKKT